MFPSYAYPDAPRLPLEDDLFGHRVADPYRWLEVEDAPETKAWSAAEDELYGAWAALHPERAAVADRLMTMVPGYRGAPTVIGARRFWTERRPGQDHGVLHVRDGAGTRVLVDPTTPTSMGGSPSTAGPRPSKATGSPTCSPRAATRRPACG
jgi:prolyl oligopeptidase